MRNKYDSEAPSRVSGTRLVWEIVKDILIVILFLTAIFLIGKSPLGTHLRRNNGFSENRTSAETTEQAEHSVLPLCVALRRENGLFASCYEEETCRKLFSAVLPSLGKILSSSHIVSSREIPMQRWRDLLEGEGVYCSFAGQIPLSSLSSLAGSHTDDSINGQAESFVLTSRTEGAIFAWRDENRYYTIETGEDIREELEGLTGEYSANGGAFAYHLAEGDPVFKRLDGDCLIRLSSPDKRVYQRKITDYTAEGAARDTLLSSFGFQPGITTAYTTSDELAVSENGDKLRIASSGEVTYTAGDEEARYRIADSDESPPTEEIVTETWELLRSWTKPFIGESDWFLLSARENAGEYTITFGKEIEGIPLSDGELIPYAAFTVQDGTVTAFTVRLDSFEPTDSFLPLLPERLAAATLKSSPGSDGRLTAVYRTGNDGLTDVTWSVGRGRKLS